MLVLVVTYNVKEDLRDEFYSRVLSEGIDLESRKEEGNIGYEYFTSVEDDNKLLLVEHWQDDKAFDFHTETSHFKMLQKLKDEYVESAVIEKYYK